MSFHNNLVDSVKSKTVNTVTQAVTSPASALLSKTKRKISNNALKDVGSLTGQLKQKSSLLEKAQISSVSGLAGSLGKAGGITGDIAGKLSSLGGGNKAAIVVGSALGAKLEGAGVPTKIASKITSVAMKGIAHNKAAKNITRAVAKHTKDFSSLGNRIPAKLKSTVNSKVRKAANKITGKLDLPFGGLMFPMDLETNTQAYLQLRFLEYTRENAYKGGSVGEQIVVYLPLPENMTVAHNIIHSQQDQAALGAVLDSINADATRSMSEGRLMDSGRQIMNQAGQLTAGEGASGARDAARYLALQKFMTEDAAIGGVVSSVAGMVPNPHPTLFFKGLNLREFNWVWRLIPRSFDESDVLQQILKEIKLHALPELNGAGKAFLKFPNIVQPNVIREGSEIYDYGNFKRSAITNISINYTAEGSSAFFIDGRPVSITLSMTFQEIEQYTSEDEQG